MEDHLFTFVPTSPAGRGLVLMRAPAALRSGQRD